MKLVLLALVLFVFINSIGSLPDLVKIGGIFGPGEYRLDLAFRYAVERVNADRTVLPRVKLAAEIARLPNDDSYRASKSVCMILQSKVAAIFGPQSENTANYVQSVCDAKTIPHIQTRWNYKLTPDPLSLNLYPHAPSLSKSYYDIVKQLGWESFVILYDSNDGLARLQSLLKSPEWEVSIRHLKEGGDWRPMLKEIKKAQETRFVLELGLDKLYEVLKQAQSIGLMSDYHNYFITTMDLHLLNLDEFKYHGTNITSIRMVNPKSPEVSKVLHDWVYGEYSFGRQLDLETARITTESALMYDAVQLFARALEKLDSEMEVDVAPLNCDSGRKWQYGKHLVKYMKWYSGKGFADIKQITYPGLPNVGFSMSYPVMGMGDFIDRADYPKNIGDYGYQPYVPLNMSSIMSRIAPQILGLSGFIKFDNEGFRSDFQLDILEMEELEGLKKVGTWSLEEGAVYSRSQLDLTEAIATKLQNRTLTVTIALTQPYTYVKDDADEREGNDRFEGFCIELIDEVAKTLGFNYTIYIVPDGSNGSKNKVTGEWNGMIRDLMDHRADVGIVDFTITTERQEAADFSMPFMNLGISILYKKPSQKDPNLLQFMAPFSVDVWIYIATAYLGVSVLLFILARMVPAEWDSPYPCIQDPDELENCFTLVNCLWFIIGTFLCQGGDIAPRAVSTRIVTSIWWFFTLIMIASYTANLAAFLTVSQMQASITGAEDLAKQTKIKYGCKHGGSTYNFFRDSKIPTYQRMWAAMSSTRPSVFTSNNEEGIDRVSKANGGYAFLMESSSIEYVVERNCDLMQVGALLDSKSYGIALPPGSPFTGMFSQAILRLKETGVVMNLKKRWWSELKGGGLCEQDEKGDPASAAELGLDNVGGVFVVMAFGSIAAIIIGCCEFMWKARKLTTIGENWWTEIWKEIKFCLNFTENSKPVRKKPPPADTDSTIYSFSNHYGYAENNK